MSVQLRLFVLMRVLMCAAEYADEPFAPALKSRAAVANPNMFQRYFGLYPLSQRIEDKKRGIGVQRYPIACAYPCLRRSTLPYTLL